MCWPRDRSHGQTPSTNQLHGPHRGFVSGTNKRPPVSDIKNTHLNPSCHHTGTTTTRPTQDCDYVVRGSCSPPRSRSKKTIRTRIPHNKRNRDVCPSNGPLTGSVLSTHSSQSGGQPDHISPLPCASSNRWPQRKNPKGHGFFSISFFSPVLYTFCELIPEDVGLLTV